MTMADPACTTETVTLPYFGPLTIEEIRCSADGLIDWLGHRYLARRIVSLLTNQWKAGKTKQVSVPHSADRRPPGTSGDLRSDGVARSVNRATTWGHHAKSGRGT